MRLWVSDVSIGLPTTKAGQGLSGPLYPSEVRCCVLSLWSSPKRGVTASARAHRSHFCVCNAQCREAGVNYGAELFITLSRQVDKGDIVESRHPGGQIPIMVKSNKCRLAGACGVASVDEHAS